MYFHWLTKCGLERLAICAVTTIAAGTVSRAITASSGEIQNIMIRMPSTENTDISSWLMVCCRLCETLSTSLVTRLSTSPRGWESK
ncbi:Uncharacterised protein [Mycobacteroides abscessus subsp. abscessus]|nr:Uncharacterised protein [Mycobacteroides abscessus subsp. abscessus]